MDETIEQKKKEFLKEQYFLAAWSATVRRNKTWNQITEQEERKEFRNNMKKKLESIIDSYNHYVTPEEHIKNILDLEAASIEYGEHCNIGACQKLLNLLCKYYWCAGFIPEPPHLVIDRQILSNFSINLSWTQMEDIEDYKNAINTIRSSDKTEGKSLVVWELENWKSSLN